MMHGGESRGMGGDTEATCFTGQLKVVSGAGPFSGSRQCFWENCTIRCVLPTFVYLLLNR